MTLQDTPVRRQVAKNRLLSRFPVATPDRPPDTVPEPVAPSRHELTPLPTSGLWARWAWVAVLALAAAIFAMANFVLPKALSAPLNIYLAQPLLWSSLAALAFAGWRYGVQERPPLSKPLVVMAVLTGTFQVALLVMAGLVFGFGYSPYGHRPLVLLGNLVYVGSMLVGMEMSRAYLVAVFSKRSVLLALASASLLFSVMGVPAAQIGLLGSFPAAFRVSGETLLPTLSENLLASFLVLVGGPVASIAYRAVLQAFEWLSPILPNLQWTITAFLGTLTPALGLLVIRNLSVPRMAGEEKEESKDAGSPITWVVVAVVGVALVWFNNGLFGVRPTLVSGGSMQPALRVGDVVITRDVSPDDVRVGDIIRYRNGDVYVLHRVVAIEENGAALIARGDANNVDDPPVLPTQLEGKLVFVVPKIGWISIAIRALIGWLVGLVA